MSISSNCRDSISAFTNLYTQYASHTAVVLQYRTYRPLSIIKTTARVVVAVVAIGRHAIIAR